MAILTGAFEIKMVFLHPVLLQHRYLDPGKIDVQVEYLRTFVAFKMPVNRRVGIIPGFILFDNNKGYDLLFDKKVESIIYGGLG